MPTTPDTGPENAPPNASAGGGIPSPDQLPDAAADVAGNVLRTVNDFLTGTIDSLGQALNDLLGGGGPDQAATATPALIDAATTALPHLL